MQGQGVLVTNNGGYSIDMDGSSPGTLYQTFATVPGVPYVLTFDLSGNSYGIGSGANAVKTLQVTLTSSTGSSLSNQTYTFNATNATTSKPGWLNYTTTFTATGTSTTLTFASLDAANSIAGPVVANVHVQSYLFGVVFEDLNYGGGAGRSQATAVAAGGAAVNGARVELYTAAGAFVSATNTNSSGYYGFLVDVGTSYTVRVVNSTVMSNRAGATTSVIGVQTYRTDASTGTAAAVADHVGGENPALVDSASNTSNATLASLTTASATPQSIATVAMGTGWTLGVDFGFNFDTIVNTKANGQGSLSQWTDNAGSFTDQSTLAQAGFRMVGGVSTALAAGIETSIFMIPNGTAVPGLRMGLTNQLTSGGYARITSNNAVALSGYGSGDISFKLLQSNTSLDGATQTANVGDTNSGKVGTGGTVGVAANTLAQFDMPEIELDGNGSGSCVCTYATGDAIRSIALAMQEEIYISANNAQVSDTLVGMDAQGNSNATTAETLSYGIWIHANSNILIHHNYVRVNNSGIRNDVNTSSFTIEYNEVTSPYNGQSATYDGIDLSSAGSTTVIQYNLLHNLVGAGIESQHGGATGLLIQQNTLSANGLNYGTSTASSEPGAIVVCCVNNSMRPQMTITGNIITGNAGDGIEIMKGAGYTISQNAIYGNNVGTTNGLGIDLDQTKQGNPDNFTLNGVNVNSGSTSTNYPNLGMNYPVISTATISGSNVTVAGYVGSASGQSAFASATLEFFKSSLNATGYGDGQAYIGTLTADSSGKFSGVITLPGGVTLAAGDSLTGTATDANGNTSEFGPNVTLAAGYLTPPSSFNAFESSTASGAVTGVIQTKQSKALFGLDLVAINASGGVYTGFTGTVTVSILDASSTTGSVGANGCNANWTQIPGSAAGSGTLSTTFTAANSGRVSTGAALIVSDAYRNLRVKMSYTDSKGVIVTSCSTDNFAMNPVLGSPVASDADWATAGTARTLANSGATGGIVHKAGQPFTLSATAANLSTQTTSNYNGTATAVLSCVLPSGCGSSDLGTLTFSGTYSGGTLSVPATYSEAGVFTLQLVDTTWAAVDAADTPAAQRYIYSNTVTIGRFVPDHFALSVGSTGSLVTFGSASCASRSFSYLGQTIPYKSVPVVNVTAQNAGNSTTRNYRNELWHLTSASMLQSYADTGAGNALAISQGTATVSATGYGTGTMSPNAADTVTWVRSTASAQSPFNAQAVDTVSASDSSESSVNGAILSASPASVHPSFDAGASMRYGRIALANAYGIETQSLSLPVEVQYFNGSVWVTNANDSCTSIPAATFTMSNWQRNLNACETSISSTGALTQGRAAVSLSAPGAGNAGSVDLGVNVGGGASGSVCVAGSSQSSSALSLSYLQGAWTGGSFTANPTGRASFGNFGLVPGFRREN